MAPLYPVFFSPPSATANWKTKETSGSVRGGPVRSVPIKYRRLLWASSHKNFRLAGEIRKLQWERSGEEMCENLW